MKARLIKLDNAFPEKFDLASSSIWSVLFRCAYELLCFVMQREELEIFHRFLLTAPFNEMRTQPTNAFFATVNRMLGGSSNLLTSVVYCFVV